MAVPFSSDDKAAIEKTLEDDRTFVINNLEVSFEVDRCAQWIQESAHKIVALQFPDSLMSYAPSVASAIESKIDQRFVIRYLFQISF